jgi:hypothetical protein
MNFIFLDNGNKVPDLFLHPINAYDKGKICHEKYFYALDGTNSF